MRLIWTVCVLASALALFPDTLAAQGTGPGLDGLARKMANALANEHVRTIAVFDFAGPGGMLTSLGQELAGEFSQSLQHESGAPSVLDRSEIKGVVEGNRLASGIVRNTDVVLWLASQLKVDAFVVGFLIPDNGQLSVGMKAIQVKSGNVIAKFTTSISRAK